MLAKSSDVLNSYMGNGGFDLDKEMKTIISTEWGCWGVLRVMDMTHKSKWWDPKTKEAVNGPQWEYKDYLVRMRRVYEPIVDPHPTTHAGVEAYYPNSIYMASVVRPKKEDIIMEIAEAEWVKPPRFATILRQHQIMMPDYKLDGKLTYTRAYVVYQTPNTDDTIHQPQVLDTSIVKLLNK